MNKIIYSLIAWFTLTIPIIPFIHQNPGPAINGLAVASGGSCSSLPFSDSFSRPNGPLGSPWSTNPSTNFQIVSDAATTVANNTSQVDMAWPSGCPGWTTSQYAKFTLTGGSSTSHFGLMVNTIDDNNFYYVDCTQGNCSAGTRISGTYAGLGSYSLIPAVGQVVCLELDSGSTLKLKVNGVYDTLTYSPSGLASGYGGGMIFANQSTSASTVTTFSTGNGTC